jgi:hypothetical protein
MCPATPCTRRAIPAMSCRSPKDARRVGASPSYRARLCRSYLTHQDEITATLAEGGRPKRAYVVCRQDDEGRYR